MPLQEYILPEVKELPPGFCIGKPKKPVYAIMCKKIGEAVDLLDSKKGPIINRIYRQKIRQSLGRALAAGFEGNFHEARNYITVAANDLANAHRRKLPLKRPKGVPIEKLKDIKYHDPKTNTDLWDTINITDKDPQGKTYKVTGKMVALRYFPDFNLRINRARVYLNLCREAAEDLMWQRVAEALEAATWKRVRERSGILQDQFDIYHSRSAELPQQWLNATVPDNCVNQLNYDTGGQSITYNDVFAMLIAGFIFSKWGLNQAQDNDDLSGAEKSVDGLENIIEDMKTLFLCLSKQMNVQEYDAKLKIDKNDIWDLILDCTAGNYRDRFEDSLDDWWGAKKYIIAVICGAVAIAEIIASSGSALVAAVANFVYCFMIGMVGGEFALALSVASCILGF